jgi:uncharacterized membrane protein YhaH (DUF805 family)
MTYLTQLLFGLSGRISRKSWWLGFVIVLPFEVAEVVVSAPQEFGFDVQPFTVPVWIDVPAQLITVYCNTALTVKRFNDRDWPYWLGFIFLVLGAIQISAEQLGYFSENSENMGTAELAFGIVCLLYFLFAFVDNAFVRGTSGPNRYGPDPLKVKEPSP